MAEYLKLVAEQIGIPLFVLIIIFLWGAVWKLLALWKSARKKALVWFVVLALVNTMGILEILYIFVFSEMKPKKKTEEKPAEQNQKTRRKRKK